MPIADLEITDFLLALVIVLGAWGGWRRGLLQSAFELATLAASLVLAFLFYAVPAQWLQGRWPWLDLWLAPFFFVLIFVVALGVIGMVLHRLVGAVPLAAHRSLVNRLLGVIPGAVNGLIHATVIAALLFALPLVGSLGLLLRPGALANSLAEPAEWLEARLTPIFDPAVQRVLRMRTVPAESHEYQTLRFNIRDPKPRPDLEARMLDLVNAERARQSLAPLKADADLLDVARGHSRDMLVRGYFSHDSPEKENVAARLRKQHVRFAVAGENLALAQTLPVAHNGLMNSPGHRANILNSRFGRVGIGVMDAGVHGVMVTQVFRN